MTTQNNNQFAGAESPANYEQKCLCVLVLDTSSSMQSLPIDELNRGLMDLQRDILADNVAKNRLEVAIVTFNSDVDVIQPPALLDQFQMPVLSANGVTQMVSGVREAIRVAEERKMYYKQTGQKYYRSWIVMMTDGSPYPDGQDIAGLANEIHRGVEEKKFVFVSLGTETADFNVLQQLAHPKFPPVKLLGLKFGDFFQWLSNSLSAITQSKTGDTLNIQAPASSYAQIQI